MYNKQNNNKRIKNILLINVINDSLYMYVKSKTKNAVKQNKSDKLNALKNTNQLHF